MSASMGYKAAWEAGPAGTIWRQLFHRVPKVPSHISLHGKTALVTGASSGLGLECARQFLQLGVSQLILTVRSQSKGKAAEKRLRAEFPNSNIEIRILDMESFDAVRALAARCESLERLDVVILNAGSGNTSFLRSNGGEGREVTLQVNYLSTTLLALLLIPIVKDKTKRAANPGHLSPSPGRLTIIGSDTALWVKMSEPSGSILDSMDTTKRFDGLDQYSKTKLLLMMFVSKLKGFISSDDVIINVSNPSAVKGTDLSRDLNGAFMAQAFVFLSTLILGRNVVDGARVYTHSALVLGKESHGSFTNWEIKPYATFMYTDAGHRMTEKLWDETLRELGIDNLEAIIGESKRAV